MVGEIAVDKIPRSKQFRGGMEGNQHMRSVTVIMPFIPFRKFEPEFQGLLPLSDFAAELS